MVNGGKGHAPLRGGCGTVEDDGTDGLERVRVVPKRGTVQNGTSVPIRLASCNLPTSYTLFNKQRDWQRLSTLLVRSTRMERYRTQPSSPVRYVPPNGERGGFDMLESRPDVASKRIDLVSKGYALTLQRLHERQDSWETVVWPQDLQDLVGPDVSCSSELHLLQSLLLQISRHLALKMTYE